MLKTTIAFVVCCAIAPRIHTQEMAPLPVEAAIGSRSFGEVLPIVFSPDGKWLAYTVQRSQRSEPSKTGSWPETGLLPFVRGLDIWIVDTATSTTQELTNGKGDNWLPTWSPDGRFLAFFSTRDGSGQPKLWIWDMGKKELRKASETIVRSFDLEWEPDSQRVLLTTLPHGLSVEDYLRKVSPLEGNLGTAGREAAGTTVTVYRSHVSALGGSETQESNPWNLDEKLADLVSIDIITGGSTVLVHSRRIATFRISPDGSSVAYTFSKRFEKPGSQQILYDLTVTSMATKQERVLARDIRQGYDGSSFSWSPDSLLIGYREIGPGESATYDCYVANSRDGSVRKVTRFSSGQGRSPYESGAPLWDSKGKGVYFVHDGALWHASVNPGMSAQFARIPNRKILSWLIARSKNFLSTVSGGAATIVVARDEKGKQEGFYKIDLTTGGTTSLPEDGKCYTCANRRQPVVAARNGETLAYFAEDPVHASDLWVSDPTFEHSRRVTDLNPQFERYKMGSVKLIDWLSDDGQFLQGALLLPAGYQEGRRYPLIVYVYGGQQLSGNVNRFGLVDSGLWNMQLLATRGYAVLCPDAPQNPGTPLLDLAKTVLPAVNKAAEMGIADPSRVGLIGHSYGGYSVLSLIAQSKRFRAAVDADGYGNLVGNYGSMDKSGAAFGTSIEEKGQGLMGGPPWQFRERYIENSPVFYLDRVETPLLIVHGAADTNVAPFLGDEVFVGLRRLGKEVEYAKYAGEEHSLRAWSYANQADVCVRIIGWFTKYMQAPTQQ